MSSFVDDISINVQIKKYKNMSEEKVCYAEWKLSEFS